MAASEEIAKDIVVAAIQQGLFGRVSSTSSKNEGINKDTAESIGEAYKIIYKAVDKAYQE